MRPSRRPGLELPPTPIWFKVWFAVCAILGFGVLGLIAWVVIRVVERYT